MSTLSGHRLMHCTCPLSRVKRASPGKSGYRFVQGGVLYVGISAVSQNTVLLWRSKCSRGGMNSSLYTANRTTLLKIVVVGLAAALMIAVIGISARELNLGTDIMTARTPTVIKAGGPVVFTDRSGPVIR